MLPSSSRNTPRQNNGLNGKRGPKAMQSTIRKANWTEVSTSRGTKTKHYGTLPSPPPKKMKRSNALDSTPPAGPSEPEDLRYDFSVPSPEATQNEYLLEFKTRRRAYLHRILQGEAIGLNAWCVSCGEQSARWRCLDCSSNVFCRSCCRKRHSLTVLHRVEKWNGTFFERASLWEVGIRLHVGHQGLRCPSRVADFLDEDDRKEDLKDLEKSPPLDGQAPPLAHGPSPLNRSTSDIGVNLDQEYVNAAALADDPEERNWDDVPADPPSTTPDKDSCGNSFLVVVDISGVHRIPVVWCSCEHANPEYQLLDLRLFPASFANIHTVFTFSVLDDFRLSNLEAKTSAYQYYEKLRRVTNAAFPNQVPNRYVELRRLSRQWRNLKYLKWHGFGHSAREPGPGELAIFCPTCPQPGINLPANWRTKYAENELLRTLVVDGNFTADHLRQKRPADDVWLSEGQGMTTSRKPYHDHLKIARETKEKDPCDSNFDALNRANEAVAYKDANGTLGHACGRHGCYCPRSVVDLQKGERQANVDWSLCEALKAININDLPRVLLIYDIMCQYHKKLKHRISVNPYLELPDIVIDKAIGLFHVHGHQDSCLFRYATSFIPGAAKIDGEIMETLWAVLNNISRASRTLTLAHRSEMYDDHMNDSNWKKQCGMVSRTTRKFERACEHVQSSLEYYNKLTSAVNSAVVVKWTKEIEDAEVKRLKQPEAMDIMNTRIPKPPTLAEAGKTFAQIEGRGFGGETSWLISGLRLEELQVEVSAVARQVAKQPNLKNLTVLASKREKLTQQITKFNEEALKYMGEDAFDSLIGALEWIDEDFADSDGSDDEIDSDPCAGRGQYRPEDARLPFPSRVEDALRLKLGLTRLATKELDLRKAFANDCLQNIRLAVGDKSFHYKNHLWPEKTKKKRTRARVAIQGVERNLRHHCRLYSRNLQSMETLGLAVNQASEYRVLTSEDLMASPTLVLPNLPGQSKQKLSWIWTVHLDSATNSNYLTEFYRVHWLRARADKNRWAEELTLTKNEMEWTVRYFLHMRDKWCARATDGSSGHKAYASRLASMWASLAVAADKRFCDVNEEHSRLT